MTGLVPGLAGLLASAILAGCNGAALLGCGFDEDSYGRLRQGLSYEDVVRLTGCRSGRTYPPEKGGEKFEHRSWAGPRGPVTIEFDRGVVTRWRVG